MSELRIRRVRVGAQTIPWGETIKENTARIVAHLAACGYHGVETGVRHFDLSAPERYRDLYRANGLEPVAIHSGGTFWDPAQAQAELQKVEQTVRFAADVGFRYFAMSGNRQETPESMARSAEAYNRIGGLCREAGMTLAYHNHNWEIQDDARLLRVLMGNTDPTLVSLVPDVAWIQRGGLPPAAILRQYRERIAYVHLKDHRAGQWCELGEGEVDLDGVLALLPELPVEWVVVEQDSTQRTPEESLEMSAEYLRRKGLV